MGKYQQLISRLFTDGKCQQSNHDALIKAGDRAFGPLTDALLDNSDDLVRESCAEILGERKSAKAFPFLIKALLDKSLYVRQDWLAVSNTDRPKRLHGRVLKWYKTNK